MESTLTVFTESEIRCLLKIQRSTKAIDLDGTSYQMLENQVDELVPLMIQLFNACWISGTIPYQKKFS